jgi:hypothetical protein
MMVDVMKRGKEDDFLADGVLPKELEEVIFSMQSNMIVWAAPSVIKDYQNFKLNPESGKILHYLDDTLRKIRKDLGHSDSGLKRGDLIKLFLRDPEELDKLIE